MYWHEHDQNDERDIPDDIQDLCYRLQAKTLPLDHALALSDAILEKLPWMHHEPGAGIHLINYPESGNGWQRPVDTPGAFVHLSGRTRLTLRLPKHRIHDAHSLTSESLDINGHSIVVGKANSRMLAVTSTLIARHVMITGQESEQEFVERCVEELGKTGVRIRKILCGRQHGLQLSGRTAQVRSVMIADLTAEESFQLQRSGLGSGRLTGCGLFVPHKGIASTTESR
jgi:CRISPR-associated protein Cas6